MRAYRLEKVVGQNGVLELKALPFREGEVIESTKLPGSFHRAPAEQIIVATARVLDIPLLTADSKILNYPYVKTL